LVLLLAAHIGLGLLLGSEVVRVVLRVVVRNGSHVHVLAHVHLLVLIFVHGLVKLSVLGSKALHIVLGIKALDRLPGTVKIIHLNFPLGLLHLSHIRLNGVLFHQLFSLRRQLEALRVALRSVGWNRGSNFLDIVNIHTW